MVVTVMAVALHLLLTVRGCRGPCQPFVVPASDLALSISDALRVGARPRLLQHINDTLVNAVPKFKTL